MPNEVSKELSKGIPREILKDLQKQPPGGNSEEKSELNSVNVQYINSISFNTGKIIRRNCQKDFLSSSGEIIEKF